MSVVRINVVTIFPETMDAVFAIGMLSVAAKKGLVEFRTKSPREFTSDAHRTVDDSPFGGGAGMIMMAPPIVDAVESFGIAPGSPVILMSPIGKRFDQAAAQRLSQEKELTFICGRYKGVDERVKELVVTEEISLGDFVLSGGEAAALAVVDAVVRLLPGVLGDHESASSDSHYDGLLSPPSYTRPPEYRGLAVPDVLKSGNHAAVEAWRKAEAERLTRERRPDLWATHDE